MSDALRAQIAVLRVLADGWRRQELQYRDGDARERAIAHNCAIQELIHRGAADDLEEML